MRKQPVKEEEEAAKAEEPAERLDPSEAETQDPPAVAESAERAH